MNIIELENNICSAFFGKLLDIGSEKNNGC